MSSIIDYYNVAKEGLDEKLANMKFSNLVQQYTKKHKQRLIIYNTLLDCMNASTSSSDIVYFSWHLNQIERRSTKSPLIARMWLKFKGAKNEQVTRDFLKFGIERSRVDDMKEILKPFMPLDEYSLYKSDDSSDQRPIIQALIIMCEDKIKTSAQIKAVITGNLFIIFFAVIIHGIAVGSLYPSFLPADVLYGAKPTRELTSMENNWYIYQWILNNYIIFLGTIAAAMFGIGYSLNNWSSRFISIRKEFFDFLPPYSIHRITGQYQIVLMLYFYLKSGKKWMETLDAVRKLSPKYVQIQLDEIILRSASKPSHEALNIFYMGEMGDIIESRSSRDSLVNTLDSTLEILQIKKTEAIDRTTKILNKFFVGIIVWGSVAYSLVPIAFYIAAMIEESQAAANM